MIQRFLALGAGVQSSTLALMIEKGEIEKVNCGIFADTRSESQITYTWLNWLQSQVSFPIHRTSVGSLRWHTIWNLNNIIEDPLAIPFFVKTKSKRGIGMIKRVCTSKYKILPLNKKIREVLGIKKWKKLDKKVAGGYVNLLLGLSYDELFRIKRSYSPSKYIKKIYPLVDLKMTREDCVNWMKKNYNKIPPRSSCTFCPYHSDNEWLNLKNNKDEWKKIVEFDKQLRESKRKFKFSGNLYLHRSCKPIDEVEFKVKDKSNKFIEGCEDGYCGV